MVWLGGGFDGGDFDFEAEVVEEIADGFQHVGAGFGEFAADLVALQGDVAADDAGGDAGDGGGVFFLQLFDDVERLVEGEAGEFVWRGGVEDDAGEVYNVSRMRVMRWVWSSAARR